MVAAPRRPRSPLFVALLALALLATDLAAPAVARAQDQVIPPGREGVARDLIADVGWMTPLEGGLQFTSIALDETTVRYTLARLPDGHPVGALVLAPRATALPFEPTSASFVLRTVRDAADPHADRALAAAAASVVARDQGGFYVALGSAVLRPGSDRPPLVPWWLWVVGACLAAAAAARALYVRRDQMHLQVRITHALPACIQLTLFGYWSLYWPPMGDQALSILVQLAYAIVLDMVLSFAVHKRWAIGFAPFPVVLSTNLFAQFSLGGVHFSLVIITLALLSKALLRRKGGGHIFNPSAFGLALFGLVNTFFPALGSGDYSHEFGATPNMTELIILLGLIVQLRVPVVLATLSAALVLVGFEHYEVRTFVPIFAPVALVLVLLITDPATLPRTNPGRVVFGVFVGLGMAAFDLWFEVHDLTDFWTKVTILPVANALSPLFDRLGQHLDRVTLGVLQPRFNRVHVALWVALAVFLLVDGKADYIDHFWQAREAMPFVQLDAAGRASCAVNPLYCEPFTLLQEARVWLSGTP